jgi:hypothetical protein
LASPAYAASGKEGGNQTFAALWVEGCYADFSDLRCTFTNVRCGEPFNKRSFLRDIEGLQGTLRQLAVVVSALNEA